MARLKNKENDILDAAIEVFLSKGFSKTNVQDIADKAGIGKGTIYEYFKSKDDLFVQALKYDHQSFNMVINKKILQEKLFFDKFIKLIELTQDAFNEQFRRINYYITHENLELNPKAQLDLENLMKDIKNSARNLIYNILETGIKEGEVVNSNIDIDFAIDFIQGVVICHCHKTCYENDYSKEQKKQENEKLLNFIMNGIGKKSS